MQFLARFGFAGAIFAINPTRSETQSVKTYPDGPVAIVSQSGGGSSVPFGLLRERGIGMRYCNAIGNQCDVAVSELAVNLPWPPRAIRTSCG